MQATEPLAKVVIDAHIDQWADRLDHAEGQLGVMRSAAARIARTLPPETVEAIRCITGARPMARPDDALGAATSPELSAIARILPSGAIIQILPAAGRTSHECFEVLTAVASVAAEDVGTPKDVAHNKRGYHPAPCVSGIPVRLAASGFPGASMPKAGPGIAGSPFPSHPRRPSPRRAV